MIAAGKEPFRVLHIMGTLDIGGISSMVLNYYTWMDREKVRFDIAVTSTVLGQDAVTFQSMGSRIYTIPRKADGIKAYTDAVRKILSETHYDAVHVHERDTSYVALRIAKQMGVKKRVAHAHGAMPVRGRRAKARLLASAILNPIYATDLLACGILAGERTYGKINLKNRKFKVLPNAIDTERFAFNPEVRAKMRKELGVEDHFVLGMVGRLAPVKNIPFAIQLVEKMKEQIPDISLLLVGSGDMQPWLEQLVKKHNLDDTIHFLGPKGDPENYYQAFDALLLPSYSEGFPVAALEAMASGLPLIVSDTVTDELSFGSAVQYLSLNDPDKWLEVMQHLRETESENQRQSRQHEVKETGYNIREAVKIMKVIYGIC